VPIATTESIILKGFAYGDTSRILRLLTRQHGVQSVIAKGALRPRSRFGGVLDPFTEGLATFNLREGRDLHTLSGFELLWNPQRGGGAPPPPARGGGPPPHPPAPRRPAPAPGPPPAAPLHQATCELLEARLVPDRQERATDQLMSSLTVRGRRRCSTA
jgi:hypothetical protein